MENNLQRSLCMPDCQCRVLLWKHARSLPVQKSVPQPLSGLQALEAEAIGWQNASNVHVAHADSLNVCGDPSSAYDRLTSSRSVTWIVVGYPSTSLPCSAPSQLAVR